MGLSNSEPKISSYQIMVEILDKLNVLASGDFPKLVKDIYALPEAEQKKADEGRKTIAEIDAKIAENNSLLEKLLQVQADIDKKREENSAKSASLISYDKELDERKTVLDKMERELSGRAKVQANEEIRLNSIETRLRSEEAAFIVQKKAFQEEQETARRKAEEIRELTKGL